MASLLRSVVGAVLVSSILACAGFDARPLPPGEPVAETLPRLEPVLQPIRTKHALPAAAGAIFDSSGQLLAVGAVGQRHLDVGDGPSEPVTVRDRWHLGSDTKAMTATLVARAVERGELDFDTPVSELMPAADPAWQSVTVKHLLSHTGGVQDGFPTTFITMKYRYGFERAAEGRAVWMADLVSEPPSGELGSHEYSNLGYILAGHLLEQQQGRPWEELIHDQLFEPLGMTSSDFGPPRGPHPWGHGEFGSELTAIEPSIHGDNAGALGPAGTVHAPLSDWAKFGALHLAAARGQPELVSQEVFTTLHTPVEQGYALGWGAVEDEDFGGAWILSHSGSNMFWYARIVLVPDHDRGYLFVTNTARHGREAAAEAIQALAAVTLPEQAVAD